MTIDHDTARTRTRLGIMSNVVEQRFNDLEEFLRNTKGLFQQQAQEIEGMAELADEDRAEHLFEDYLRSAEVFPELFMTAWIISSFSYFEHFIDSFLPRLTTMQGYEYSKSKWDKHVKEKGKFVHAKNHIQNTLDIHIAEELWTNFNFHLALRNHLTHEGRIVRVNTDNPKKIFTMIEARDDIRCDDKHPDNENKNRRYKIVIQKRFAIAMCTDLKGFLLALISGAREKLPNRG